MPEQPPEGIHPASPEDVGVPERELDVEQIEPARLLANDARDRLTAAGFTDEEVVEWARAYVAEVGEATTVDGLVDYIAERERRA
jgi:hypothetical protein